AAYAPLTEALLFSAPPAVPPPALRARLLQAAAAAHPSPAAQGALWRSLRAFFAPSLRLRPALALAVLVLFLLTNAFWWQQVQQSTTPPTVSQSLLNFIGSGTARRVEIATQPDAPAGALVWAAGAAADTWIGVFSVQNLPPLSAGTTYQGWLIRAEQPPLSIGTFNLAPDGSALLIFEISQSIGDFDLLGITAEPTGGSPAPTTDPIIAGQL
ncbi:MAG: anti-sigma factor, partial [Anaerolineae bacterium]|nr:anti-sigma factor [Anaerolineae bacterium]